MGGRECEWGDRVREGQGGRKEGKEGREIEKEREKGRRRMLQYHILVCVCTTCCGPRTIDPRELVATH